jgi:hypothetical protein
VKKLPWLIILKSQIAFVLPALLLINTGVNLGGGLNGANPLPKKKLPTKIFLATDLNRSKQNIKSIFKIIL